jgi:predicted GNAT superfamily acetyltransferase
MPAKLTIEHAQNLANSRGFKFLSLEFKNTSTKHLWECNKRHEWSVSYHSIHKGSGCPHCVGRAKKTIQDAHEFAKIRGYKFLSFEFINVSTNHLWGCDKGHQWSASYNSIQQGSGCPNCKGLAKKTIQDAKDLAESRGYKFLSPEFKGTNKKYLWGCEQRHKWCALYARIYQGSSCPYCAGKKTIQDAQDLAEIRGYKFLSPEFKGSMAKHLWGCVKGHNWSSCYSSIQQGRGCPICSDKTRGEKLTRYCFEKMLQFDFHKIKP